MNREIVKSLGLMRKFNASLKIRTCGCKSGRNKCRGIRTYLHKLSLDISGQEGREELGELCFILILSMGKSTLYGTSKLHVARLEVTKFFWTGNKYRDSYGERGDFPSLSKIYPLLDQYNKVV